MGRGMVETEVEAVWDPASESGNGSISRKRRTSELPGRLQKKSLQGREESSLRGVSEHSSSSKPMSGVYLYIENFVLAYVHVWNIKARLGYADTNAKGKNLKNQQKLFS